MSHFVPGAQRQDLNKNKMPSPRPGSFSPKDVAIGGALAASGCSEPQLLVFPPVHGGRLKHSPYCPLGRPSGWAPSPRGLRTRPPDVHSADPRGCLRPPQAGHSHAELSTFPSPPARCTVPERNMAVCPRAFPHPPPCPLRQRGPPALAHPACLSVPTVPTVPTVPRPGCHLHPSLISLMCSGPCCPSSL